MKAQHAPMLLSLLHIEHFDAHIDGLSCKGCILHQKQPSSAIVFHCFFLKTNCWKLLSILLNLIPELSNLRLNVLI